MTTQGESSPSTPDPLDPTDADQARKRLLLISGLLLAGVVVGGALMLRPTAPADHSVPGGQNPPPVAGAQPLTEAQAFTAERYFPGQRGIDQDGVKARRTGAGQGTNCLDVLHDRTHDPLHGAGCQGYVSVSYTSLDQKTQSSVTVLRFNDDAAAANAVQLLQDKLDTLTFVPPDGSTPAPTASADTKGVPKSRVERVGHYLTVTASRYADAHAAPDAALDGTNRVVAYAAEAPFLWL